MRLTLCLGAVVGCLGFPTLALGQWTNVAPGLDYRRMDLPGPVKVFVARADRRLDTWTIDSMTSKGTIKGGFETVPDMVKRYDDTVTWDGRRYEIKIAINGDFHSGKTGYATGGQIIGGWYAKRYNDFGGLSAFFWTSDRRCAVGGDVLNGPKLQQVVFADKSAMNINKLNDQRERDELALYTSHWDRTTGTDNNGVEALVRMDEPVAVNPRKPGNRGVILKVADKTGSTSIPFDCVVLSAAGTAASRLLEHAKVGTEVHFDLRLDDLGVERYGLKPARWENVWGSLGATQNIVVDGKIPKHWEAKAARYAAEGKPHGSVKTDPRTAVAYNRDYVFFIVIDGRSPESIGMTYTQAAEFCKNELKADYAVLEDGGGSSTLWVDGQVKNTPSERNKDGKPGRLRAVANGSLIALVHPAKFSKVLKPSQSVKAKAELELKLGPGGEYAPAGKVAAGATGQILKHKLDGVYAKGANWWLIQSGETEGWAPETGLMTTE